MCAHSIPEPSSFHSPPTPDNGPEITKAIKSVLKDDYNYDSTVSCFGHQVKLFIPTVDHLFQPTFYALYRSFTQCLFIEEDDNIVFYKNKHGLAAREIQQSALKEIKENGWNAEEQDRIDAEVTTD